MDQRTPGVRIRAEYGCGHSASRGHRFAHDVQRIMPLAAGKRGQCTRRKVEPLVVLLRWCDFGVSLIERSDRSGNVSCDVAPARAYGVQLTAQCRAKTRQCKRPLAMRL